MADKHRFRFLHPAAVLLLLLAGFFTAGVQAVELTVEGPDGEPITEYRWLVEEDLTRHIEPGRTCLETETMEECLSLQFHRSYMPVVAEGDSSDPGPLSGLDPTKRYFISVLPDSGYSMGGAQVAKGQASVTVTVNAEPVPLAQIRVLVFEDNYPINNAPDLPQEQPQPLTDEEKAAGRFDPTRFSVLLFDAAGRFGVAGGQMIMDAFGNPIGTTYDADGEVVEMGSGTIHPDENGIAEIKNLPPGKFGVQVVPPAGEGWAQTSTIEGTKTIDAWVKANEPPYFTEFGPPGPHVFVGFVRSFADSDTLAGGTTISGQIRNIHQSRPPEYTFYTGEPFPECWIGLNDMAAGIGKGIFAAPCDDDSRFTIPNVPPGSYQLAVWDKNLDIVFGFYNFTVDETGGTCNNGQSCAFGDVPVFAWFSRLHNHVFFDANENGIWDEGEVPMPEQLVNLRFRDGSIYQSMPTDFDGASPFEEVFPFFHWLVAEVDFARFKATGATVVVDAGGPVDPNNEWGFGVLNPQPQSADEGAPYEGGPYRVETGPVLTQAFQGFLGQSSVIQWGKSVYDTAAGENGGISGMVYYAVTRAEDDPRFAAAEEWEPGIPRIQVNLYRDCDGDGQPDQPDPEGNGCLALTSEGHEAQLADVDNYPYGWADDGTKGPEDLDRNGDGTFDAGDAIQITYTDSWDDSQPTGCRGDVFSWQGYDTDCFDGLRNFNQVRPGVFDGGYAFADLTQGTYIVESGWHPVYKTVKEEDRNVDFGEQYAVPELLPAACVGDRHLVPDTFSLFDSSEPPYRAGTMTPLCDRKQVALTPGMNAVAEFFMFTYVPIAGRAVGFVLDDLANEFDPNSPMFGEKYSPPFVPISIRDWSGREIGRTYTDRWGSYNALVPSMYTNNLSSPGGMSPNMLITCMNAPGRIPNPDHDPADPASEPTMPDPFYNRQYSQFCYTFQYMPGTTTYLDTPVVPVAAFAGPDQHPLDCELPDGTPVIWSSHGPTAAGPWVANAGDTLTLISAGTVPVPNPAWDGTGDEPKQIPRNFGFGNEPGTLRIDGQPVAVSEWSDASITFEVPYGGQVEITRADGATSVTGITVTVGGTMVAVTPGGSIQEAIDLAQPGDLVLVPPGTYEELVVMWKPVRLQGSGAATLINAVKAPGERLLAWRDKVEGLIASGAVDMLPSQEVGPGLLEPGTFNTEEGPAIIVLAKDSGVLDEGGFVADPNAHIDGFTITGADHGGGIFVNGYARHLAVANNRIFGNTGVFGGGIRIGHPQLVAEDNDGGRSYEDAQNDYVRIHHNYISRNGANGGVGGGVSINNGADHYAVTDNFICGNFTQGNGAGIGHLGLSDDGLIARNRILFNESFNQGVSVSGGGLFIGGAAGLDGPGSLSAGAGNVKVIGNLIQGNLAGAGDGGGVRLAFINGQEVVGDSRGRNWHTVDLLNNLIVNNVAGLAGGGVSLQDALKVNILNNTIAHNDSTATAGEAFAPGSPNESTPQPAGIVSRSHSSQLEALLERSAFAGYPRPDITNTIVWQNRAFHFVIDPTQEPPFYGLLPAPEEAIHWDLGVIGATGNLQPRYSLLTDNSGHEARFNISGDPAFAAPYFNGDRGQTLAEIEHKTSIAATPAFDEGGNFIHLRFGPLTLTGDYHLTDGSAAINAGTGAPLFSHTELTLDYDGEPRPSSDSIVDIGADEHPSPEEETTTTTTTERGVR